MTEQRAGQLRDAVRGPAERAAAGDPGRGRPSEPWASIGERLRARGLRWTSQRRLLVDVLAATDGHVTGAELVDRCRAADPATTPSTVYRTLDVLEELGLVRHCHGADGREEFHVLPQGEHGHLYCAECGGTWEIGPAEAAGLIEAVEIGRGFEVDLSHVTVVGRCAACRSAAGEGEASPARAYSATGTARMLNPPST